MNSIHKFNDFIVKGVFSKLNRNLVTTANSVNLVKFLKHKLGSI